MNDDPTTALLLIGFLAGLFIAVFVAIGLSGRFISEMAVNNGIIAVVSLCALTGLFWIVNKVA